MEFGIRHSARHRGGFLEDRAAGGGARFPHAWFYDTQMLGADPFVAMGAAAVKTTGIRFGTGVLVPSNRIAPNKSCRRGSSGGMRVSDGGPL